MKNTFLQFLQILWQAFQSFIQKISSLTHMFSNFSNVSKKDHQANNVSSSTTYKEIWTNPVRLDQKPSLWDFFGRPKKASQKGPASQARAEDENRRGNDYKNII